jgi:hypothetical protein
MADLSQRHLAECAHQAALPFGRQRLPDRTGRPLAHRVIQASAQPRVALGDRVSGIRRILSNYQRRLLWDIECAFKRLKSLANKKRPVGDLKPKMGLYRSQLRLQLPFRKVTWAVTLEQRLEFAMDPK